MVLQPLRQLGHPALAVGQAKLVLGHDVGDLEPAALEAFDRELEHVQPGPGDGQPFKLGRLLGVSIWPIRHLP